MTKSEARGVRYRDLADKCRVKGDSIPDGQTRAVLFEAAATWERLAALEQQNVEQTEREKTYARRRLHPVLRHLGQQACLNGAEGGTGTSKIAVGVRGGDMADLAELLRLILISAVALLAVGLIVGTGSSALELVAFR